MNSTRLLTSEAKLISCVTTSMVRPPSASERMTSSTSPTISRVERGGGFVKEQHFRVHGQCARDGDALASVRRRAAGDARCDRAPCHTFSRKVQRLFFGLLLAAMEDQCLPAGAIFQRGHVVKEVEGLENQPHARMIPGAGTNRRHSPHGRGCPRPSGFPDN